MLTLKHIELTGHITVTEAVRVTEAPIREPNRKDSEHITAENVDYGKREVFYDTVDGHTHNIQTGTVYVMNSNGETVSRFMMGDDGRGNTFPKAA